jgi:AraC-like DNA-binding protein
MQKVGFTDRSAFYRSFSELVGMTPAEYRAAYKNKGK